MPSTNLDETIPLPLRLTDRLAPEIYDRIIDHLHSFKPGLSACSTVCKLWLPASRYHLFFDINLTPKLVKTLSSSCHAMKTVTPYIRNVALGGAWSVAQRADFDIAISLLLNLDNVRGLILEAWNWDFLSSKSTAALLSPTSKAILFQTITKLHLNYIRFPSFPLLATFIGGFSTLEDLSFNNVTWAIAGYSHASMLAVLKDRTLPLRPLQLRILQIRSCPVEPILHWLFGNDSDDMSRLSQDAQVPALRSIAIPEVLPNEIRCVGSVMRALGSSLHHLEVGFLARSLDDLELAELPSLVNLSQNRDLQSIHIHQLTLYRFPPRSDLPVSAGPANSNGLSSETRSSSYPWLIPFLSHINSTSIEDIILSMWFSEEPHLDFIDWSGMAGLLIQPEFSGIQMLEVRVLGIGEGRHDVKAWLLQRLTAWPCAKIALQVAFVDH